MARSSEKRNQITSNTDAIYTEFPFLEKIYPWRHGWDAKIERWDDELFDQDAGCYGATRRPSLLLNGDGEILTRVGERRHKFWFLRWRTTRYSETLGQALARIGEEKAETVRFVLESWYVFRGEMGSTQHFVLYKLPKRYKNAEEWRKSCVEKRKADIASERKKIQEL